jgi:hypothetical protein
MTLWIACKTTITISTCQHHPLARCSMVYMPGTVPARTTAKRLTLKVSKQKWSKIGSSLSSSSDGTEMYLLKLGSNITALREFTALCRVEQLSMKRFLLADQYKKSSGSSSGGGGFGKTTKQEIVVSSFIRTIHHHRLVHMESVHGRKECQHRCRYRNAPFHSHGRLWHFCAYPNWGQAEQ